MFDSDMNKLGACDKPDPMQFLTCPDVLAADSTVGIIHCRLIHFPLLATHIELTWWNRHFGHNQLTELNIT